MGNSFSFLSAPSGTFRDPFIDHPFSPWATENGRLGQKTLGVRLYEVLGTDGVWALHALILAGMFMAMWKVQLELDRRARESVGEGAVDQAGMVNIRDTAAAAGAGGTRVCVCMELEASRHVWSAMGGRHGMAASAAGGGGRRRTPPLSTSLRNMDIPPWRGSTQRNGAGQASAGSPSAGRFGMRGEAGADGGRGGSRRGEVEARSRVSTGASRVKMEAAEWRPSLHPTMAEDGSDEEEVVVEEAGEAEADEEIGEEEVFDEETGEINPSEEVTGSAANEVEHTTDSLGHEEDHPADELTTNALPHDPAESPAAVQWACKESDQPEDVQNNAATLSQSDTNEPSDLYWAHFDVECKREKRTRNRDSGVQCANLAVASQLDSKNMVVVLYRGPWALYSESSISPFKFRQQKEEHELTIQQIDTLERSSPSYHGRTQQQHPIHTTDTPAFSASPPAPLRL